MIIIEKHKVKLKLEALLLNKELDFLEFNNNFVFVWKHKKKKHFFFELSLH